MYRIAVFSDIHGNMEALHAILTDLSKNKLDEIIFLGDAIGLGPNSKESLDLLFRSPVEMVLGNHELYFLTKRMDVNVTSDDVSHNHWVWDQLTGLDYEILRKKPMMIRRTIMGHTLTFIHYPYDNFEFRPTTVLDQKNCAALFSGFESDYIFYGHDHVASTLKKSPTVYVNVGSSGCVWYNETYYTIVSIDKDVHIEQKIINYDRQGFVSRLLNTRYPMHDYYAKRFFGIK